MKKKNRVVTWKYFGKLEIVFSSNVIICRFGHVFLFDTGTSNGNLSGQSRTMSSIDFRPARPYRLVSGSEDNTVALFEGPPFKFMTVSL